MAAASRYLGLVVGERTGRVYSVINPEHDRDLNRPEHLAITVEESEQLKMVKWPRKHQTDFSYEGLAEVITDYYVRTSTSWDGPEVLKP